MTHPTLPTSPADQAGETPFGLNEADLADYLLQTPEFFTRHADVLHAVQFSNPHGGRAISLQERQAEVMRDKIRSLEAQMRGPMGSVNSNAMHALTSVPI